MQHRCHHTPRYLGEHGAIQANILATQLLLKLYTAEAAAAVTRRPLWYTLFMCVPDNYGTDRTRDDCMHVDLLAGHKSEVDEMCQGPDDIVGSKCGHKLGLQRCPYQVWLTLHGLDDGEVNSCRSTRPPSTQQEN